MTSIPPPGPGDALLVVDVQNDFLPGGALAVPGGDEVVPVLNEWTSRFSQARLPIFATRDWHPPDHSSFTAQGGTWPPHCIAGSHGAAFSAALALPADVLVVSKGDRREGPGYSAFDGTDLPRRLRALGVRRLFVGGLATDYCVLQSVLEAIAQGFDVVLLTGAVRAVDVQPGDGERAIAQMRQRGAVLQGRD